MIVLRLGSKNSTGTVVAKSPLGRTFLSSSSTALAQLCVKKNCTAWKSTVDGPD